MGEKIICILISKKSLKLDEKITKKTRSLINEKPLKFNEKIKQKIDYLLLSRK